MAGRWAKDTVSPLAFSLSNAAGFGAGHGAVGKFGVGALGLVGCGQLRAGSAGSVLEPAPPRIGLGDGLGESLGDSSVGGGSLFRKRSKSGPHPAQLHWPRTPVIVPTPPPAAPSASSAPSALLRDQSGVGTAGGLGADPAVVDREVMVAELDRIRQV
jgi:hypothetical protein